VLERVTTNALTHYAEGLAALESAAQQLAQERKTDAASHY